MSQEPYLQDDIKAFLREKEGLPAPPQIGDVPAQEVRTIMAQMFALLNAGGPVIPDTRDIKLNGVQGPRSARIYRPRASSKPQPCMIYFHGGGWIIGDLETEDRKLRQLAKDSGMSIISVDYVLAPEHQYPVPAQDCLACIKDVMTRSRELQVDPTQIVLGGASAGANLALASALALRDEGLEFMGILLFYGAFDLTYSGDSMELLKSGYFLDKEAMYRFRSHYCPHSENWKNPDASPLFGNFADLPKTFLSAPQADPLYNDSSRLNERMLEDGVNVELKTYPGAIHGFTMFQDRFECAREGVKDAAEFLKSL